MPRETHAAAKTRATAVIHALEQSMPEAKIELDYTTPLQLLVAVILSAQCTDKRVNLTTPALFKRYPDAASLARAELPELEGLIKSCGFFRMKAKNIRAAAHQIVGTHGGQVPTTRVELERLAGVGNKTAGVVAVHLGGDFAFPVDTHVGRLSRRLAFTTHADPDKVELDLQRLIPKERWGTGHQLLVWHGRRTCFARSPACERCGVLKLCPQVGVARKQTPKPKTPKASARRARP